MARILHIADLHLDAPLTSNFTVSEAAVRRSEQLETFSRIMSAAGDVDVVLIAGDLFDGENVSRETLSVLAREFESLGGIPVFISPGNHDPYPVYERLDLGENVRVFPPTGGVFDIDECRLRICGAGFGARNSAPKIGPSEFEKHEEYTNILLLHGDISGAPGSERYNPLTAADFNGFDYAALGHIHRHDGINEGIGGALWAYPGIPEPRGFDEGEGGGYIIGGVSRGKASLEHVPAAKRGCRVYELSQDGPVSDNESLISLASSRVMSGGAGGIVRIILKGRTKSGFRPDAALIKDRLRGLCFSVEVRDETVPELDLTADENDGSLRAVYIKAMRKKALAFPVGSRERKIAERALRLGVGAMESEKGA